MGYYSEVALCLSDNGRARLDAAMHEARQHATNPSDIELFLQNGLRQDAPDSEGVLYYWEGVKWYADFEEVRLITDVMDELDVDDYLFLRIGEDVDDAEILGGWWENPFDARLFRTIDFG